jgi:DNA-binding transcriptional regulator YiaG
MPNIGSVLKAEITRLSRKEVRSELEATKKASAQHRRYIAELRRQVSRLERQMQALQKRPKASSAPTPPASLKPVRFVAKGLRSNRERLGLSAGDYGKLIGVSAQSIYNWEREAAAPREAQKVKLAWLRGMGSKEARARLSHLERKGG